VGVGIDLLEIERLERERAYAAGKARPGQHLAARFCAKEAVAKALGLRVWSWQDIEVLGGPTVVLHGPLAGARVDVSLTHSRGMAAAVAMVRP
jgi:holo-[acyl-carrier protein] synthase